MNSSNDKPTFLDRGTIIAFVIIMAFWFAWSKYMETKYPAKPATATATQGAPAEPSAGTAAATSPTIPPAVEGTTVQPAAPTEERLVEFSDPHWSFRVSSKGMGLRDIDIKGYKTRENEPVVLGNVTGNYPFATGLASTNQLIDFAIEKVGEDTFVGRANVDGMQIEKTMKVNSANYTVATDVKVQGAGANFKGLETFLSDGLQETKSSGFLSGSSYDHQGWYLAHEGTNTRNTIVKEKGLTVNEKNVEVLALSSHYFAMAIVDRSPLMPRFEANIAPQSPVASGRLIYQPINAADSFAVQYTGFAGPKALNILTSIDARLGKIIDYGMFAVIAHPLLWLLKYLYSLIGNWGWAIVGLTIIVRLIVMPFNIYSFKSMKAMQKIQPEMTRIREKYKDKPADQKLQMNQEIMELMKRSKANPLGGCLPMLLQLPVFFALYQVLGQSIELYRVPFIFWIHDLSSRDPYYVLPVLMGITMFVQQKITPTTMDPQQAKILMWMPVIFSFFMLTLPSGLTLYIFVSTLFGIIQQYMFMKDRTPATTVKEAKA